MYWFINELESVLKRIINVKRLFSPFIICLLPCQKNEESNGIAKFERDLMVEMFGLVSMVTMMSLRPAAGRISQFGRWRVFYLFDSCMNLLLRSSREERKDRKDMKCSFMRKVGGGGEGGGGGSGRKRSGKWIPWEGKGSQICFGFERMVADFLRRK